MNPEVLRSLLPEVTAIARRAAEAILAVAAEDTDARQKADGSPVTRADLAAHRVICDALARLDPRYPILSEEGDLDSIAATPPETFWCVDPLDGTKEFIKGLGEYTVNIALIHAHRPVLGVVGLPVKDEVYQGIPGSGAWKIPPGSDTPEPISANPCPAPCTAVVSRSHLSAETEQFLADLGIHDRIQHGSSLKICAVAEGKADIYPRHGPTCLWDTAAGTAVAIGAGCAVVDLHGAPLSYNPAEGLKRPGFIVYPEPCAKVVLSAIR